LGNSGVGKSFLANICLQNEKFEHLCKPTAVTTKTEYEELNWDGKSYLIFNIPGLVEAQQEQIDRNKQEINKAFQDCPNSIVIYVFGTQQGRIRSEDIVAFNALNDAYPFGSKSLVLVVNGIPKDHDQNYEGETKVLLRPMLKMEDACKTMCFLDTVDKTQPEEITKLSQKFFQAILNAFPKVHEKKQDIQLDVDKIKDLKDEIGQLQTTFNQEREQMLETFRCEQQQHEAEVREQHQQYEKHLQEHAEATDRLKEKITSYEGKQNELEEQLQQQGKQEDNNSDIFFSNPLTGMVFGLVKGFSNLLK
jgi:methyl-accepting chemotaxis protein